MKDLLLHDYVFGNNMHLERIRGMVQKIFLNGAICLDLEDEKLEN
jgi:hypothetical protein